MFFNLFGSSKADERECKLIEALRSETSSLRWELKSVRESLRQHSESAEALYTEIYGIAKNAIGTDLPDGCTPLDAVDLLNKRLRETQSALKSMTEERDGYAKAANDGLAGVSSAPPSGYVANGGICALRRNFKEYREQFRKALDDRDKARDELDHASNRVNLLQKKLAAIASIADLSQTEGE